MMFAVSPQNDIVSFRTQTQKERHDFHRVFLFGTDTQNGTGPKTKDFYKKYLKFVLDLINEVISE